MGFAHACAWLWVLRMHVRGCRRFGLRQSGPLFFNSVCCRAEFEGPLRPPPPHPALPPLTLPPDPPPPCPPHDSPRPPHALPPDLSQVAKKWRFYERATSLVKMPDAELLPNAQLRDLGALLTDRNYQVHVPCQHPGEGPARPHHTTPHHITSHITPPHPTPPHVSVNVA